MPLVEERGEVGEDCRVGRGSYKVTEEIGEEQRRERLTE